MNDKITTSTGSLTPRSIKDIMDDVERSKINMSLVISDLKIVFHKDKLYTKCKYECDDTKGVFETNARISDMPESIRSDLNKLSDQVREAINDLIIEKLVYEVSR